MIVIWVEALLQRSGLFRALAPSRFWLIISTTLAASAFVPVDFFVNQSMTTEAAAAVSAGRRCFAASIAVAAVDSLSGAPPGLCSEANEPSACSKMEMVVVHSTSSSAA